MNQQNHLRQNKLFLPDANRLHNKFSSNTDESLKEFLLRRNRQLLNMFSLISPDGYEIKLTGRAERPNIIVNGKFKLSAYAHNFDLIFKDRPFNGEEVLRLKINSVNKVQPEFFERFIGFVDQEQIAPAAKPKRKRIIKQKIEPIYKY